MDKVSVIVIPKKNDEPPYSKIDAEELSCEHAMLPHTFSEAVPWKAAWIQQAIYNKVSTERKVNSQEWDI